MRDIRIKLLELCKLTELTVLTEVTELTELTELTVLSVIILITENVEMLKCVAYSVTTSTVLAHLRNSLYNFVYIFLPILLLFYFGCGFSHRKAGR